MIVREAGGSVRDGLSLLDQIFSYCGEEVKINDVVEVLGLVSHQLVADLGIALLRGDLAAVYRLLEEMYLHGTDIKRFSNDLLSWFRGLVVCKVSKNPGDSLEVTEQELAAMMEMAATHTLATLSALFSLLLEGLEKASFSQQPRLALELTFIRAVQIHDVVPVAELIARFDQMLAGTPLDSLPTPPVAVQPRQHETVYQPVEPARIPSPSSVRVEQLVAAPSPVAEPQPQKQPKQILPAQQVAAESMPEVFRKEPIKEAPPLPHLAETEQIPKELQLPVSHNNSATTVEASPQTAIEGKKRIRQHWDAFLKYVHERQPWMAAALQLATSVERKGDELLIHFDDSADCTMLKQRNYVNSLVEFVLDYFQENLSIQFVVPGSSSCAIDPANGLAPQQERRALANDPLVLTALDIFTGQVGDIRVGPRSRTSIPDGNALIENQIVTEE